MYKHGHTSTNWKSRTYSSWDGMKQRCNNPNATKYENYGGRGIKYQESWENFQNFLEDMGECPEGFTLDRIDANGNYSKENCRWANSFTQNRNTRTNKYIEYNGISKTNQEWALELKIPPSTLYNRVFVRKWPIDKAFNTKIRKKRKNI